MTGFEYQQLAMRTAAIPEEQTARRMYHGALGLTSEAGEVCGILQKVYQGHELDKDHMVKELGDCLWMIAELCSALGVTLDEVMQVNIDKLKARYPQGFEVDKSLHRAEEDI